MGNVVPFGDKSNQSKIESDIVKRIKKGDVSAFETLFNIYSESLLDYAVTCVKSPQIAEDIVQEVFVNVWKNKSELNPSLKIKAYLFAAVKNQSLKYFRHKKIERQSEDHIASVSEPVKRPDEELGAEEFTAEVQKAVNELPEKCRMIFSMNRYNGLTYTEIAEIQGISINTVKTQMARAFKFLRIRLAHLIKSTL